MQNYSVNQHLVNSILAWVQAGEIVIPEIQRPFVWDTTKVRDLMDSLYKGFPIGYIIAWKNPDVRLKDGTISSGRKILIDGQQRITALRAAILGEMVVDQSYREIRMHIAFNPITEEFATLTPAIAKDPLWIEDISKLMCSEDMFGFVEEYCDRNKDMDRVLIGKRIQKLIDIKNKQVGFIELAEELDIDTVTEIFIRINSKGVVLSQADFAMSKIASYGDFGVNLRKCIDYFCHLAQEPKFFKQINENDKEFSITPYLNKIAWLKNENDNLYDPDYSDVIRVSFTKKFERGKMSDLVSLLSGRNFETRSFEQEIMDETFEKMKDSVLDFVNETHFKRFIMIIKSAGFISRNLINSQNSLNFAYALYLKLRELKYPDSKIEKYVRQWFVMSVLTGRYSSSPESMFDVDIKSISRDGVEKYLQYVEEAELSDAFWNVRLVQELNKSVISNPFLRVFFAAQVYDNDKGFLSSDITVRDMIENRGDIHHVFPKKYLRAKFDSRSEYNQIANFVYAQSEINIKIGDKAPVVYMNEVLEQCKGATLKYGNISNFKDLHLNLEQHCIPSTIFNMDIENYEEFLQERRKLMAKKIHSYYRKLANVAERSEMLLEKGDGYEELIKKGESDALEFKSTLRWDMERKTVSKIMEGVIAKTIAAFMNCKGGMLLIGVKDDGQVLGLGDDFNSFSKKPGKDSFLLQLDRIVNDFLGKDLHQYVNIKIAEIAGKDICAVEVLPSGKPVFAKGEGKDEFYIRASASSQPLSMKEANDYIKSHWNV